VGLCTTCNKCRPTLGLNVLQLNESASLRLTRSCINSCCRDSVKKWGSSPPSWLRRNGRATRQAGAKGQQAHTAPTTSAPGHNLSAFSAACRPQRREVLPRALACIAALYLVAPLHATHQPATTAITSESEGQLIRFRNTSHPERQRGLRGG